MLGTAAGGATIYVTLEPCNHTGQTPPCTQKICQAGIKRVVVARHDPNPAVTGGGLDYLREQGLSVTSGVCETEARKQLEWFEKYIQTGLPFVTLKCALTLDGRIATRTGDSKWVTGEQARAQVHKLRQAADAIMVGIGTVKSDNPSLTTRIEGQPTRDPVRVILDSKLSIDEEAGLLQLKSDAKTILITGPDYSQDKRDRLEKKGAQIIEAPLDSGYINLAALIKILGEMKLTSLLIEGGGRVSGSALAAGIVDKICFFYAPKILGGDDGVPVCSGSGPSLMKNAQAVRDMTTTPMGNDILVEGYLN